MTARARARMAALFLALTAGGGFASEWAVTTESVARIAYTASNTATVWGYHQPMIARAGQALYCALLEPYGEGFAQQWSLYQRAPEGWSRRWSSPRSGQLNQPPSLVADLDGTVHVFAWPDGVFTHYRFAPGAGGAPAVEAPPSPYDDLWPYAAAAIDEGGELLVVASAYPENLFSFRSAAIGGWRQGLVARHPERPQSLSGYDRQAYPFVALAGRQAHVFTVEDIADPEKIAAGADFVYSFRNLHYFHTSDILAAPFARTRVIDVEDTRGWVHNDDLLVDRRGAVHLLYQYQRREGDWGDTRTVHAFGPPDGPFQHVQLGGPGEFNSARLWESPEGVLYAVLPRFTDLFVAPLGSEGGLAGEPADLGIASTGWGYYGRFFLAARRSAAGGAPFLEGLYFAQLGEGDSEVRYFRATPEAGTAVAAAGLPSDYALRLHPARPNPFNGRTAIAFEVDRPGAVGLTIVDLLGRRVRTLVDGPVEAGEHQAAWDGRDDGGRKVATGAYLVRLTAADGRRLGKVLYVE